MMMITKFKRTSQFLLVLCLTALVQNCGRWKKSSDDLAPNPEIPLVSPPEPSSDRGVRLRGYDELSHLLETSMMSSKGLFSLSYYTGGGIFPFFGPYGIAPLMGYYNDDPLNTGWKNVEPNTAGTSAYLIALTDFASDLSRHCVGHGISSSPGTPEIAALKKDFADRLVQFCDQGPTMPRDDIRVFWSYLTAKQAPASEFDFWHLEILALGDLSVSERLEFAVVSAAMTPEVLFFQ